MKMKMKVKDLSYFPNVIRGKSGVIIDCEEREEGEFYYLCDVGKFPELRKWFHDSEIDY